MAVAIPLSGTSPSDKSPTAMDPAVASPISDREAIVEVLLKFGFKLGPGANPVDEKTCLSSHRLFAAISRVLWDSNARTEQERVSAC